MTKVDRRFSALLTASLEGRLSAAERREFQRLMHTHPSLRAEYVTQLRMHALLLWRAGGVRPSCRNMRSAQARRQLAWMALAATVAVLLAAFYLLHDREKLLTAQPVGVEMLDTDDDTPATIRTPSAPLMLSGINIPSGERLFRLESGAVVAMSGATEVQFFSPTHLKLLKGKVTVDVADSAHGFTVTTAQVHVVDLGTKFGVEATRDGHTHVVVFKGEVALYDSRDDRAPLGHLTGGEAVKVDTRRRLSRITNIATDPVADTQWSVGPPPDATAAIIAVQDDAHESGSKFYYRILPGGMREIARPFHGGNKAATPDHQTEELPAWLQDADMVQPFDGNRKNPGLRLTVTLGGPSILYVFLDERIAAPGWLKERFTYTGVRIVVGEPGSKPSAGEPTKAMPCGVWQLEVPQAGSVTLGPPPAIPDDTPHWMYGIAAKRL